MPRTCTGRSSCSSAVSAAAWAPLSAGAGSEAQAANAVAAAAATDGAPVAGDGKARLQEVFDGGKVIVVNDAFDKTWRRVGLAIERAGLAIEDKDRARGIYFLGRPRAERSWMDSLKFWQDEPSDRRFRVNVKDGGASTEVAVTDKDGVGDDETVRVLESLYKNIEQ